ncbi:MAG: nitroreductase family protein, partial [Slackia sp.]|nr:nitroreductase family protein [Slackia sp.]
MVDASPSVVVDARLCTGCGRCVKDCFPGVMHMENGSAVCRVSCMECGHCVAVCPEGAVRIEGSDMDGVEEFEASTFGVEPDHLLRSMKFRRSIRSFKDGPLGEDMLHALIEAGRYAPTARNTQGTEFLVIQNEMPQLQELLWRCMPAVVESMAGDLPDYARIFGGMVRRHEATGEDGLLLGAPAFVLVLTENMWDGGLAAANMEMMAAACGAGVLHSGFMKRVIERS